MENNKRCCFAGHRSIYNKDIKEKVKAKARELISVYNVKNFWIGNYGDFDGYCVSALMELKKEIPDITVDLVIPYLTLDLNDHKDLYYDKCDNILVPDISPSTPKHLYIIKTNEYMVNNSDYLICYINYTWGGAAKTYEYAKRKKLKIFNIADEMI